MAPQRFRWGRAMNNTARLLFNTTRSILIERGAAARLAERVQAMGHRSVLLVTDGHGVQFLIRDLAQMDRFSRKLLDRFL